MARAPSSCSIPPATSASPTTPRAWPGRTRLSTKKKPESNVISGVVEVQARNRVLQPAFGTRDACGFDAVAGAQFADGFGEIIPHGAVGEAQLAGDIAARHAFAGQP